MAMKRTLKLKWDAFKKGIPCNVSCRNELLTTNKPIHASSYAKKTYKKLQVLQMQRKTTSKK